MNMPAAHVNPLPTLADLLRGYADAPAIAVHGIASDTRQLGEGYVFFAVQGHSSHGLDYVEQACAAGICAVVWDASTVSEPPTIGVPAIAVDGLAAKLGEIADRYYRHPSERLGVIGVTGTNGKTTVAWMVAQAFDILGRACAYLGTLGQGLGKVHDATGMTTPPAIELHGRLAEFVDDGAEFAAVEVSSHALSQRRVDGVRFDTALFTNLSRDHLDYHQDMDEYFASKTQLFLDYGPRQRIVNVDTDYGMRLAALCGPDVVTVSTRVDRIADGRPYVFVRSVDPGTRGSDVTFDSAWGSGAFATTMPGDFNVANAAIVLALLLNKGVALDKACEVVSLVSAPPGRMQRVAMDGPAVYVDYAHTPDALENVLQALRGHCAGTLWCVFGCGGDRDAGKRPQMGEAAERGSDCVVITSDNPRSEDPATIIADVLAGLARPEAAILIEDRAAAIAWAVGQAASDDVVLVAGKGHEAYQETSTGRVPLSDYAVAQRALSARGSAS
ncbi:MAG: UDP-N-acetylmuramoyl-L-alanyl-D-glutamate--2,6-diaminopimelate ligase [Gammaproteobacteria bacterium]|nr:UDP-N-acetylmuramoyl-L-alanyl-D-glutamate--2,6-diaminopimelate ligase [Gammaproteobacteria bacterium]NNF49512.1 UDP-N-acetylmuramoyl-L-alanyl-D-glutamate--2,6-diaminopimelate ligase [Woeseiaceae bacterium]MBT8094208.1 UDP-N-acetylmuramoyl-L-alanyl-D-glutamate--2,6-diaminopimelate ligase [Gammaproteobacteria bacterium]MBT8104579.1 UDP-N-acetylmuramoyl-L-alanyl-D-glutamate--2,6-diaminopimelate ligase [Gammaproteobacteria bacterium]NNK24593.1 UDP-N-acetylmuramoyl-L-alanyl-D-glutamate--2,6-diami